jgi:hypothetical protein
MFLTSVSATGALPAKSQKLRLPEDSKMPNKWRMKARGTRTVDTGLKLEQDSLPFVRTANRPAFAKASAGRRNFRGGGDRECY